MSEQDELNQGLTHTRTPERFAKQPAAKPRSSSVASGMFGGTEAAPTNGLDREAAASLRDWSNDSE